MKKSFLNCLKIVLGGVFGVIAASLLFSAISCNVGLGESVDTEAPTVAITYPPSFATIRKSFVLGGTWSDDKGVTSVAVNVYRTESDDSKTTVYSGNATVGDGTWQITLNSYDSEKYPSTNGWEYCDGSYEISVEGKDDAGHSSGTASRAFTIDNTAPVLVLTKPTTVGSNTAKAYGRTVQLEGTMSEGCTTGISELVVSFYNSTGAKLFDSSFTNITDMSNANPLTIAQYYDEDEVPASSDENYSKWENYQKLYGSDAISTYRNDGTAKSTQFYFTVTASDAAKVYQDVSDSGVSGGNVTTTYYRGTTEMLNLINSKNDSFPDFTVASLRSYLNGTDSTYSGNSDLQTILSAAESVSSSDKNSSSISSYISNTSVSAGDVYLTFTMNPANNPTYTISGLAIDTSTKDTDNYTDGYYHYYADSTINASVATGLDGTNLDTSTISIYYAQVDSEDKKLFWTWDYDVAHSYAIAGGLDETTAKANISADPKTYRYTATNEGENSDSLSVTSSLSSAEITSGIKYIFSIEGKDIDGQSIAASSSNGFGFMAKSNATTPKISIGSVSGSTNLATQSAITGSVFSGSSFAFSGTVTSSEEISAKSYTVTVTDSSDTSSIATATVEFSNSSDSFTLQDGTEYVYDWKFTVSPTDGMKTLISNGSGLFTVDVAISATNGGGTSSLSRTYFLDTTAPKIPSVAVSTGYTASDGTIYLNNTKTFTLSGSSTDNYLIGGTSYTFTGVGTDGKSKTLSSTETNSNISWSFENIDLSGFKPQDSKADITLTVTATDKAGNSTETEYSIELDTTAPAGKHIYDKKNKDLIFRIGETDNELSELKAYNPTITELDDELDKDVGGKYKYDSWNSSQTLTIRGDWTEEGSGVKMIYYKFYTAEPTDEEISAFLANYATLKDGYFSPSIEDDDKTKRVSYTDSDGTKKFTEITSSFKTIISGLSAGSNYIVFVAVDNVGNAGVDSLEATCVYETTESVDETELAWNGKIAAVSINVDVESPSATSDISGTQYTNKVSEIKVTGTATDNASGIASVVLTVNGNSVTAETGTDEGDTSTSTHWRATIPASALSGLNDSGNYPVALVVTDNAGNQNSNTAFSLQVDTAAPTVGITNPGAGTATLNGEISVSGTVSYTGAVPSSLALYYSLTEPTSDTELSSLTQIGETIADSSKIYSWSFSDVDVTTISKVTEDSPKAAIYLVPVVYDTAGNCNIYTESTDGTKTYAYTSGADYFSYTVDQNYDRPVIQITSIDDADSWLKSATVQGTVTDDDGISTFQVSENNSTWTTVSVSNGTWSYSITSGDGEGKTLYFKVTDTAGTTFTTGDSSKFKRPYYLYADSTSSGSGYAEYGFDNSSAISVKLDTNYPAVGNAGLAIATDYADYDSSSNTDGLATISDVADTSTAGVLSEYEISASRYAGGNSKYIKFYVPVYDANISNVKITIADTAAGTDETSSYKTVSATDGKETDGTESIALTATTTSANVVSTSVGGETSSTVATTTTYTYWESGVISVADVSSTGTKTLKITASDAAGNETSVTKTFYVDNEVGEESITITSPSSDDEVTGTVNVVGTATDTGIGLASIEWLVPPADCGETDSTSSDYKSDAELSKLEGWTSDNNTNGIAVFNFKFLAGDKTDLVNYDDTKNYAVTYDSNEETYKIPLFIRATDKLGNIYIKRDFYLTHNPDADRPLTEISYPTETDYDSGSEFITLSGTIRVNGTVEIPSGTTTVGKVYIQIGTVADDGTITWTSDNSALADEFTALGGAVTKSGLDGYSNLTYVSDDWWGIPCTTKTSTWNLSLNSNGNLNPTTDGETTNIAVRACAINADGKMGRWTDASIIHVDSNAPSQSAVMRQYSTFSETALDSNITVQKDYLSEMYLKGTWYLTVTLSDNDSLVYKTINVKRGSASTTWYASTKTDLSDPTNGVSNTIYIPIVTTDITTSSVSYSVYVEDSAGHSSTGTYTFYIDNTAPTLSGVSGNGKELATDAENSVADSDYVYTISGTVKDSGSGYERVMFYFMRNGTIYGGTSSFGTNYILDPLVTNWSNTDSSKALISGLEKITLENNCVIYAAKVENASITSTTTDGTTTYSFTDSTSVVDGNNHIHAGGLIYINGEFGKITDVSGSAVTFTMDADPTSQTTVYFPYVQSVDNTSTEDVSSTTANPFTFSSGDDGDLMPESITNVSTTWTWKGTIHSTNIPDGPAYLVVLAMDAAGNVSGETYPVSVTNNAPRLAKLYLGTDLNSDSSFVANEFSQYNVYNANENTGVSTTGYKSAATIETAKFDAGQFTAKDKLAVIPEITGGNGDVYMVYKRGAKDTTNVTGTTSGSDSSGAQLLSSSSLDVADSSNSSYLGVLNSGDSLYAFELTSAQVWQGLTSDPSGATGVSFTFWDSTEERTAGTNSQNCVAYVSDLIINLADSTSPTNVINPFYWTSSSDNSLYENSASNGHIELEADWKNASGYTSDSTSGTSDDDPKVSGKIKITGTAFDNKMLQKISLSAAGFSFNGGTFGKSFDFATFDGSTWTLTIGTSSNTAGGAIATDGWQFEINTETLTQSGHTVTWTLYLDTEKVSNVAALDSVVNASATDWASKTQAESDLTSATSSTQTTTDSKTSYYKMDIVPYIAGIKTSLSSLKKTNSSIFDRTALGHYPVASTETIYVYGFNLSGGTLYDSASTAASASLTSVTASDQSWYSSSAAPAGSVYSVESISSFTSGNVYVTVNSISSLNNTNSNDSKGDYTTEETIGTTGSATVYANYYNRQPNGDSNNLLTDDVVLDVWEFRTAAKPVSGKIEQPVMKINPAGDNEIGFAFTSGPLYFSMPGGVDSVNAQNSYNYGYKTNLSYNYWIASYDFFTSVGLTYDKLGHAYGVAAGGDINSSQADHWDLMSSRWGVGTHDSGGSYDGDNIRVLESIGLVSDGTYLFDKQRIKSPSLVTTSADSSSTKLYLAYYDSMNGQIRFRSGTISSSADSSTGGFVEASRSRTNPSDSTGSSYRSLIAGGSGNASKPAGEYVSIGAIENGGTSDDLVMAVWYDQTNRCLWYNYTKTPNSDRGTTDGSGWSTPVQVFTGDIENAGEYCQLVVDGNNGVHIAAYDPVNCDLVYAYLPASKAGVAFASSDFSTCVVDANGVIGSNVTIDVSLDKTGGTPTPRIGYYGTSCIRPKYAYPVEGISSTVEAGSVDDAFTQKWECSVVPTLSSVNMQSNQYNKMNVGVWKNTSGVANSPSKTATENSQTNSGSSYTSYSYGYAYSNSTGNPVLGYVIKVDATSDEIQTAQMQ